MSEMQSNQTLAHIDSTVYDVEGRSHP